MNATEYEILTGHAPENDDLERVNCTDAEHRNCGTCADCGRPRTQCTVDVYVTECSTEPWRWQLTALATDMEVLAKRMLDIAGDARAIRSLINRKNYTQEHMSELRSLMKHTHRNTWVPEVK